MSSISPKSDIWPSTDNGQAFQAALEEKGWLLARRIPIAYATFAMSVAAGSIFGLIRPTQLWRAARFYP
jgi:hypothetical protein